MRLFKRFGRMVANAHWIHRIRWKLGLFLLYRERAEIRDSLWEIMNCGIHDDFPRLGNPSVELNLEVGHNQAVKFNNGARTIYIALLADQVVVSAWGKIPDESEDGHENVLYSAHNFQIPHCPNKIRDLVDAVREKTH